MTYALAALAGLLFLMTACFYLIFTIRLLPVAFPAPTPTALPTATFTPTPPPTATFTPTASPTPTATFTPSLSHTDSDRFSHPPPASSTPGISIGSVWARVQPGGTGEIVGLLLPNTPVEIHAAQGAWLEVSWQDSEGGHRGWVPAQWIQTAFLTPTP